MDPTTDQRLTCLRPSSQPALTREQVQALPAGMIVLRRFREGPWRLYRIVEVATKHRCPICHIWEFEAGWSTHTVPLGADCEIRYPKLPRISARLTEEAVRARRKTVTRRLRTPSWCRPGVLALVVDRNRAAGAIGLAVVEITAVTDLRLDHISIEEVELEGFPGWTCLQFLEMFCKAMGVRFEQIVSRIEWRYL
jgi:hypothetical protein